MKKSNDEWDMEIEAWLKKNDKTPAKDRTYLTKRQMDRRTKKEIPVSSLPKGLAFHLENEIYSTHTKDDADEE